MKGKLFSRLANLSLKSVFAMNKKKDAQTIQKQSGSCKKLIAFSLIGFFAFLGINYFIKSQRRRKIQSELAYTAYQRKQVLEMKIQKFITERLRSFKIKPQMEEQILSANISDLKQLLYEGKVSVVQILMVFIRQSVNYGMKLHLITDVLYEEAYTEAMYIIIINQLIRKLDQLIKQDKSIIYQEGNDLFGIPVSVKDMFMIQGTDSTYGTASRCFKPDQEDACQIRLIKQAGGIVFLKTNVPQIGFTIESNNNIFGRATNPWDLTRTSGGSSGGEGGIQAISASVVGLGSDLGGSVRIPAQFNGLCGIVPSSSRNCHIGQGKIDAIHQWINLKILYGPIARKVDDLVSVMKVLLNRERYEKMPANIKDIYYLPLPFNDELFRAKGKLKIGFIKSFNIVPSCQANQRGVDTAIELLRQQGHQIIPFDIDQKLLTKAVELFFKFAFLDTDFISFYATAKGEKLIPEYKDLQLLTAIPKIILRGLGKIFGYFNYKRIELLLDVHGVRRTGYETCVLHRELIELQQELAIQWEKFQIDALITPVTAAVALKHGQVNQCLFTVVYTCIWNILNYGAGVVPVSKVLVSEQFYSDVEQKFGKNDSLIFGLNETMKNSSGLPVVVQVITQPFKEEIGLRIMKEIENLANFKLDPQQYIDL